MNGPFYLPLEALDFHSVPRRRAALTQPDPSALLFMTGLIVRHRRGFIVEGGPYAAIPHNPRPDGEPEQRAFASHVSQVAHVSILRLHSIPTCGLRLFPLEHGSEGGLGLEDYPFGLPHLESWIRPYDTSSAPGSTTGMTLERCHVSSRLESCTPVVVLLELRQLNDESIASCRVPPDVFRLFNANSPTARHITESRACKYIHLAFTVR